MNTESYLTAETRNQLLDMVRFANIIVIAGNKMNLDIASNSQFIFACDNECESACTRNSFVLFGNKTN